jgi:hypothetical protein
MITLTCANGHATRVLERNATKRVRCQECGEALRPASDAPPAGAAAGASPSGSGVRAATPSRKRLLANAERLPAQEAHVKAMAFWSCFGGALLAIVGAAGALKAMSLERATDSGLGGVVTLGLALGFFVTGIALFGFVPWARKLMIVLNVVACGLGSLELLGALREYHVPVADCVRIAPSIAWTGAATRILLGSAKRVFDPMYRGAIERDGAKVHFYSSPFFWGPWIAILVALPFEIRRGR